MRATYQAAPAWAKAAKDYYNDPSKYCAEDGALFTAETEYDPGISGGKCKSLLPYQKNGGASPA